MSALAIGAPSQVLVTPSTVSLSAPAAGGGTAPITYQWYRDVVPGVVPGPSTILAGQTSLSIIDGMVTPLNYNSIYYYLVQATDSSNPAQVVNSSVIGICTATQSQVQYQDPSVAQFQDFYDRDFPFGSDINTQIRPKDILKALQQANAQINALLYLNQQSFTNGCLWLAAHYLCVNINNSSQGLNGQFNWGESSKIVGPISQSFAIPESIASSPVFNGFTKTTYGAAYLLDLYPRLAGAMSSTMGWTKP